MNPLSGLGFEGSGDETQMVAIFKDGKRSYHFADDKDKFKETYFDQTLTPIKTIKAYYFSEKEYEEPGLLLGIELLDFSDQRICRAGNTRRNYENTEVKEFELMEGERLLGIKYGRRLSPDWCYAYDVQFIIGKLSS
jgi:hypothetical protein